MYIWDNFGNGADKNAKDFKGFAPIHLASAKGLVSTVKFLLDQSDTIEKQPLNQDHSNVLLSCVKFFRAMSSIWNWRVLKISKYLFIRKYNCILFNHNLP